MTGGPRRQRVDSRGAWEAHYGYCRALRVEDRILVSGCTSERDGTVRHPDDPGAQLRVAIDTALQAIVELGGRLDDVVRTRMYLTHRRDGDAVGTVHGAVFGPHRPVATMVIVAGLLHPDMRVEIELEAVASRPFPPPALSSPPPPLLGET